MEKENQISFKAVTEGLGFHPFADGMPYKVMGSGAELAGRPKFAHSHKPTPSQTFDPEFFLMPQKRSEAPKPPQTQLREISISPENEKSFILNENTYGFGYMSKRSVAYLLDTVLNCVLGGGALILIARTQNLKQDALLDPGIVLVFVAFLALMNWALITAQEVAFGSTVGKRTFGLYLDASAGKILARSLFFTLSVIFSGVGLIWALFDGKKRCWHDVASGVQPQELARF